MLPRLCLTILSCSLLHTPLSSQIVGGEWKKLHRFDGSEPIQYLGTQIAAAGDVNADGVPDIILGTNFASPAGETQAGSAFVHSGKTGAMLWRFDGHEAFGWFAKATSGAGDVDGDGFGDLIVGAPNQSPGTGFRAGSAYLYSGATGQLLRQFNGESSYDNFGSSVAGIGDLDGDGQGDIIIGATGADPGGGFAGSTYVYSGASGNLIWRFNGIQDGEKMGNSVANAGDVDGDNIDDILIGAMHATHHGHSFAGAAYVYSGATGALIWQFDGKASYDLLGSSVAGAGDTNGDGHADIIVGLPGADSHGYTDSGAVLVYCGASGEPIRHFTGHTIGDQLGASVSGGGDVNGDGIADLIAGASTTEGNAQLGSAYLWSGATGELLHEWLGATWGDNLGSAVAVVGDWNDDRLCELAIGVRTADPQNINAAGSVLVVSLTPFLHTSSDELSASAGLSVQLDLNFPVEQAGANYGVLASAHGTGPSRYGKISIPLTSDSLFVRMLDGWDPPSLQNGRGVLDGNGNATATLHSDPSLAAMVGTTICLAAVTYDPTTKLGQESSVARYLTVIP